MGRTRAKPKPAAAVAPPEAVVCVGTRERYTARLLRHVYQWCRANPAGRVVVMSHVGGWHHRTLTAAAWLAWFRAKLAEKIAAADPRRPTGRKADGEYQTELYRLSHYVGARLVYRGPTPRILGGRIRNAMAARVARSREAW